MVAQTMDQFGQIDVPVDNAGIMIPSEPFLDIRTERWDELWGVNVRGSYLACRYVVPVMMAQRRGSIVNIGSRAANGPSNGGTAYNSSKIALRRLTPGSVPTDAPGFEFLEGCLVRRVGADDSAFERVAG